MLITKSSNITTGFGDILTINKYVIRRNVLHLFGITIIQIKLFELNLINIILNNLEKFRNLINNVTFFILDCRPSEPSLVLITNYSTRIILKNFNFMFYKYTLQTSISLQYILESQSNNQLSFQRTYAFVSYKVPCKFILSKSP